MNILSETLFLFTKVCDPPLEKVNDSGLSLRVGRKKRVHHYSWNGKLFRMILCQSAKYHVFRATIAFYLFSSVSLFINFDYFLELITSLHFLLKITTLFVIHDLSHIILLTFWLLLLIRISHPFKVSL
jgi:hypothetical protein